MKRIEKGQIKPDEPKRQTVRQIYISSILWTTLAMFLVAGIPSLIAFNLAWGAALGAMSAVWAGPGYGVMIAGARVALQEERLAATTAATSERPAEARHPLTAVVVHRAA